MSAFELLTRQPFPGWAKWATQVDQLPVPLSLVTLSKIIADAVRADGVFIKVGAISALSSPGVLLRLLSLWRKANFAPDVKAKPLTDIEKTIFITAARELHAKRDKHPALANTLTLSRSLRLGRKLWFTTLEQRWLSRSARLEISRAELLYGSLWEAETGGRLFASAYEDLPSALALAMALQKAAPLVLATRTYFSQTRMPYETIHHLLCYRPRRSVGIGEHRAAWCAAWRAITSWGYV
jgi:hypothetical protein